MKDVPKDVNAEFLLLMLPVNFQVEPEMFLEKVMGSNRFFIQRDYFKELVQVMWEMGIPYVNLVSEMRKNLKENTTQEWVKFISTPTIINSQQPN